jgi:hypothetical protein
MKTITIAKTKYKVLEEKSIKPLKRTITYSCFKGTFKYNIQFPEIVYYRATSNYYDNFGELFISFKIKGNLYHPILPNSEDSWVCLHKKDIEINPLINEYWSTEFTPSNSANIIRFVRNKSNDMANDYNIEVLNEWSKNDNFLIENEKYLKKADEIEV